MYDCHSIFSRQTNQRKKLLVHVSYPYHAYLESRPEIKNSCWIEHGKTFCNIFLTDVHREKITGFFSKKTKKKFAWFSHFKHVFVSYTSWLVLSILKKSLTVSKRIPRKTRFFVLARTSFQLEENQLSLFLMKLKLIKMNSWMSKLTSDTKLSMLWTKFYFHIQVELFLELPTSQSMMSV